MLLQNDSKLKSLMIVSLRQKFLWRDVLMLKYLWMDVLMLKYLR